MSKRALKSLKDCLFNAFANEDFTDPHDEDIIWAIYEGINRLDPYHYEWRDVKANKDHKCIRGHQIKERQIYFKHAIGAGWGADWKFCAGCMAMILYFKDVDQLPLTPYARTHWDVEAKKPIRIDEIT